MKNILCNIYKSTLVMLSFFTRIPVKINSDQDDKDYELGIIFLPVIGIIIGLGLFLLKFISFISSKYVTGLILTVFYLWISGGIHLDGLGDTLDGLLSGRDKERSLEIMKDSRMGTFGTLGLVVTIFAYVVLLGENKFLPVFLMPIIGKTSIMLSAYMSDYAREEKGMGYNFIHLSDKKVRNSAFIFAFVLSIILDYMMIIPTVITLALVAIVTNWIKKKIRGATGDTLGFINELSQMSFLLFSYYII